MIESIFGILGDIVTGGADLLVELFTALINVFYTSTGDTPGLTVVGVFTLIATGFGLVLWGFRFLKNLLTLRKK